jgi:hypothetical protein
VNGCVEVAFLDAQDVDEDTYCETQVTLCDTLIAVRDSKAGVKSPVLLFTASEWRAFTSAVRAGEFDLPNVVSTLSS